MGYNCAGNSDLKWTWEENKRFENGLVEFPEGTANRWEMIATAVGTKTATEVEENYIILMEDIAAIEAGRIELPQYPDMDLGGPSENQPRLRDDKRPAPAATAGQRKPSKPWTKEEHRLFLLGLETYGKGDWKSISRYVVLTKNPSQVASHAQKHFERQEKDEQHKKRRSIFDASSSSCTKPAGNRLFVN